MPPPPGWSCAPKLVMCTASLVKPIKKSNSRWFPATRTRTTTWMATDHPSDEYTVVQTSKVHSLTQTPSLGIGGLRLFHWTRTSQRLHHHPGHDQLCGQSIPDLSTQGSNTEHLRPPHPHLVRRVCTLSRLCNISSSGYVLVRLNLSSERKKAQGCRP